MTPTSVFFNSYDMFNFISGYLNTWNPVPWLSNFINLNLLKSSNDVPPKPAFANWNVFSSMSKTL